MDKKKRYKIKDEERGHRKKLSPHEDTLYRGLSLPRSLAEWWTKVGVKKIRAILYKHAGIKNPEE